jgi:hypothetical protein
LVGTPVDPDDAVTKTFAEALARGFGPKFAVQYKTTNADADYIFATGAFSGTGASKIINGEQTPLIIDGTTVSLNDRILFAATGSTGSYHFGIYDVKAPGATGTQAWQLQRSDDCNDSPSLGEVRTGISTWVLGGATHVRQGWFLVGYGGQLDNPGPSGAQSWSIATEASSGITSIEPQVNGVSDSAFTTNGGTTTNILNINPSLFTTLGTFTADTITATGSVGISGSLNVSGTSTLGNVIATSLSGAAIFASAITGTSLNVSGNISGDSLNVSGVSTLGMLNVNGDVSITGTFLLNGISVNNTGPQGPTGVFDGTLFVDGLSDASYLKDATFNNTGAIDIFYLGTTGSASATGVNMGIGNYSLRNINSVFATNTNNTAIGYSSIGSLTGGGFNTAVGALSLSSLTVGSSNTAIGGYALRSSTTANQNTAIGSSAMEFNTTGSFNVAVGRRALYSNITGGSNTALGTSSLLTNTSGNNNTAVGTSSLNLNTTGSNNTAVGVNSLRGNTTGIRNVAVGSSSLLFNSTGSYNVGLGASALNNNLSGNENTAIGDSALASNTIGNSNVVIGYSALFTGATINDTVAIGARSLLLKTSGDRNIGIGTNALFGNLTGTDNTAIGHNSGSGSGSFNTSIGSFSQTSSSNRAIAIGYNSNATFDDGLFFPGTGTGGVSIASVSSNENSNLNVVYDPMSGQMGPGVANISALSVNITTPTTGGISSTGQIRLVPNSGSNIDLVNNPRITGLGTPISGTDAVTKAYADSVAQGFGPKLAVRVKTTNDEAATILASAIFDGSGATKTITNSTTGAISLDTISLDLNDRILFAATGPTGSFNFGIYDVTAVGSATGAWQLIRSSDANDDPATGEVSTGIYTFVREGAVAARQGWSLISYGGTLDFATGASGAQVWSQVTQAGSGLSTITPVVLGQTSGSTSFVTDGGITNNTLTLNPLLFDTFGTATGAINIKSNSTSGSVNIATNSTGATVNIGTNSNGVINIGGPTGSVNICPIMPTGSEGNIANPINIGAVMSDYSNINIGATMARFSNINIGTSQTLVNSNINIGNISTNFPGGSVNIGLASNVDISSSAAGGTVTMGVPNSTKIVKIISGDLSGADYGTHICATAGTAVTKIGTGTTTGDVSIGGGMCNIVVGSNLVSTKSVSIGANATGAIDISCTGATNNVSIKSNSTSGNVYISSTGGTTSTFIGTGNTTGAVTIGNANNSVIIGSTPTASSHVVTKGYVDNLVPVTEFVTITGALGGVISSSATTSVIINTLVDGARVTLANGTSNFVKTISLFKGGLPVEILTGTDRFYIDAVTTEITLVYNSTSSKWEKYGSLWYPTTQSDILSIGYTGAASPITGSGWSSCDLSGDGKILAITSPGIDAAGSQATGFLTHNFEGGAWRQNGPVIVPTGITGTFNSAAISVSRNGGYIAVGNSIDGSNAGGSWVFNKRGDTWIQMGNKLLGTGASTSQQGRSVALSSNGNILAVGGPNDTSGVGGTWMFERNEISDAWVQVGTKLLGTGAIGSSAQGSSVDLSGDGNTLVVGGPLDNYLVGVRDATGATWVFQRANPTGSWIQYGAKLVGAGAIGECYQGDAVKISEDGNTLAICGPRDNSNIGAVWIFTRPNITGAWSQQGSKIVPSSTVNASSIMAIELAGTSGDILAIAKRTNSLHERFIYTRSGGVWTMQSGPTLEPHLQPLLSSDGTILVSASQNGGTPYSRVNTSLNFTALGQTIRNRVSINLNSRNPNISLSADGNTLAASAWDAQTSVPVIGISIFRKTNGIWQPEVFNLTGTGNSGPNVNNQGAALDISSDGNTLAIGAGLDGATPAITGAVWIFNRTGSSWAQQGSKLTPTGLTGGASVGIQFGSSVALSGDGNILVGGAPAESILSGNNDFNGAAVVFTRPNITGAWSQHSILRPFDRTENGIRFGSIVSISENGNVIAVTEIGAGGLHIFRRNSSGFWIQQGARINSAALGLGAFFSTSTSMHLSKDGNTIALSTPLFSSNRGCVAVLVNDRGRWVIKGTYIAPDFISGFGTSVKLNRDASIMVVGMASYPNLAGLSRGVAHIYTRNKEGMYEFKTVLRGEISTNEETSQGTLVSISGDGDEVVSVSAFSTTTVSNRVIWMFN